MQHKKILAWIALAALMAAGLAPATAADDAASKVADDAASKAKAAEPAVFARVNGGVISAELYDAELSRAFRAKFYHGKPPEAQLAQLRRDVGDTLIDRVLLIAEARQRGIEPDAEKTREGIAAFAARNRDNPRWEQARDQLMPLLTQGLEEQSIVQQLERAVREVPPPGPQQVREYFEAHQATYTEPERLRLSVILLQVDPGAAQAARGEAVEAAKIIRQRLIEGADFAELARERSSDPSAPKGGDMGYLHRGMLPEPLQAQIDQLAPGVLSEPVLLLEGAAIFRLEDRLPARPMSFEQSQESAAKLWQAERAERQWLDFKAALRKAAVIEVVDPTRYPDVAAIDK